MLWNERQQGGKEKKERVSGENFLRAPIPDQKEKEYKKKEERNEKKYVLEL